MTIESILPKTHKCCNHAIVAAYLNVLAQITNMSPLVQYLSDVSLPKWLYSVYLRKNITLNL